MFRLPRTPLLLLVALGAACADADVTQPVADDLLVTAEAKPQFVACMALPLRPTTRGEIRADDCLFDAAGRKQREDLYIVNQKRLGISDRSGAQMLTFSPDASFDGIYGISVLDESTFGDLVYGSERFPRALQSFSFIASAEEYKLFFSGADSTQLGRYTLTTTVEPSAGACNVGRRVYMAGNVSFSSTINDGNACTGTISVGPNIGGPLKYQFWYAKLRAGQQVTLRADGVDPDESTFTLAAIRFNTPFALLDFSAGPGDTDRELSFTAPVEGYYYLEVSGLPGVDSPYTLTFISG